MKVAIVSSADLAMAGRMDAGFHVLREQHREREEMLAEHFTADQVSSMLENVAARDLQCLKPLSRRNAPGDQALTRTEIGRVIEEYPHLALAVVESGLREARQEAVGAVTRAQAYADTLDVVQDRLDAVNATLPGPGL